LELYTVRVFGERLACLPPLPEGAEDLRGLVGGAHEPRRTVIGESSFEVAKIGEGLFHLGFEMIDVLLAGCEERFERALEGAASLD